MKRWILAGVISIALIAVVQALSRQEPEGATAPPNREEVVFWHFWGGADRDAVEDVAQRFNVSQDRYWVRPIAMPGNNLDVKLFLAITGADPPDLVNQDDPIVADWASRGALVPIDELASGDEIARLNEWLFPAARKLGEYDQRLFALCNGLDIRALFCNETMLADFGLDPPQRLSDLDEIAHRLAPPDQSEPREYFGYLPDSRRLWAWGYVFGGSFYDAESGEPTLTSPPIVAALEWMVGYSRLYGADEVAAFRLGDQSLPGKTFPLLPVRDNSVYGRYAVLMDGQWRCRDIDAFVKARRERGLPVPRFTIRSLPPPPGGRTDAGWVNGNFFVVPRGSHNPRGAWEFMKFWSGFDGHEAEAAATCRRGGWIPVSKHVANHSNFRSYLDQQPLFAEFVRLAGSPNQFPVPVIPGAPMLNREVKGVAELAMSRPDERPGELLKQTNDRIVARRQQQSSD